MNKPTQEDWENYYADLREHERYMEEIKPSPDDFDDSKDFDKAMTEWHQKLFCDAPNKPGYSWANND